MYGNLPDEALIDFDREMLENLPHYQDRLTVLLEKQKTITQSKKPLLKRIAAFFNF